MMSAARLTPCVSSAAPARAAAHAAPLAARRSVVSLRVAALPVRSAGRALTVVRASAPAKAAAPTVSEELVAKSINAIRFLAIDGVEKANSGHPGLPMGCAPMTYVIFREAMKFNPKNPQWFNRDRFVLSAGHGSMLQYSILHLCGYDSVSVRTRRNPSATHTHAQRPAPPRPRAARAAAALRRAPCAPSADRGPAAVPPVGQQDARTPGELHHRRRGGHHGCAPRARACAGAVARADAVPVLVAQAPWARGSATPSAWPSPRSTWLRASTSRTPRWWTTTRAWPDRRRQAASAGSGAPEGCTTRAAAPRAHLARPSPPRRWCRAPRLLGVQPLATRWHQCKISVFSLSLRQPECTAAACPFPAGCQPPWAQLSGLRRPPLCLLCCCAYLTLCCPPNPSQLLHHGRRVQHGGCLR